MNKYKIHKSYTIAEKHPLFLALCWCALAVSKDESRSAITKLHVEHSDTVYTFVGTDGRRLHMATYDAGLFESDIDELLPGNYEIVSRSSRFLVLCVPDELVSYPNWRQVLPANMEASISLNVTARTTASICLAARQLMATDYLVDACGFGTVHKKTDSAEIYYAIPKAGEAVLIENGIGKAVVMPMRFDNPEIKDETKCTAIIPSLEKYCDVDEPARVEAPMQDEEEGLV